MDNVIINKLFEFGQKVMIFRKQRKLNQVELAEILGLRDQATVCSLENGKRMGVSFKTMVTIARLLGYDLVISFVPLKKEELDRVLAEHKPKVRKRAAKEKSAKQHIRKEEDLQQLPTN